VKRLQTFIIQINATLPDFIGTSSGYLIGLQLKMFI